MSNLLNLLGERHSEYVLGTNVNQSPAEITELVQNVLQSVPSAMNSQTSRAVVFTGDSHARLWEILETTQKEVLGDMFANYQGIFQGAKTGFGTIVFFEDHDAIKAGIPANEERQNLYKEQHAAIAEYATWLALREIDLGASLQHFNIGYKEGFDKSIREEFNLPESWEMNAQMPFGSIEHPADKKEKINPSEQVLSRD